MKLALIDGDEIAYKAAIRCQQKYWVVKKDDKVLFTHHDKNDCIEFIENDQDLELDSFVEDLGKDNGLQMLDSAISSILFHTNTSNFQIFLNGNKIFRYDLATLQPYKGDRDESKRPIHLEFFKDECRYRGAISTPHLEADDMLVVSYSNDSIICSQDKDLKTVSSWNYDTIKDVVSFIDEDTARYNFFFQLLIGDSTDNIPSPYLLGKVTADKILQGTNDKTDKGYFKAAQEAYKKFLSQGKTKWYNDQPIDEVLWEIGNLIYMHRTLDEDERWELP